MEIQGLQLALFIVLVFIVGAIVGCVLTARHYSHREALREAEETGRKKEMQRLPPPSGYESFLRHVTGLCKDTNVERYDIRAYGETFTFLSPKGD